MARIITHHDAQEQMGQLADWTYNLMDCTSTREVRDTLDPRLLDNQRVTYDFEMACQGPALSMMLRGIAVDEAAQRDTREAVVKEYGQLAAALDKRLGGLWTKTEKETGSCRKATRKDGKHKWPKGPDNERACVDCGAPRLKRRPFNPLSSHDAPELFYRVLKIPEQLNKQGKASTDKEVLDRIDRRFAKARPWAGEIKKCRGLWKLVGVLDATREGRYWSSFTPGAAWTGRFSSSDNPYGWGGNSQNVTEKLRTVFVADPGKWMFYADLEQAESNLVAHLCGDENYIEAHKSGNVHVTVARFLWPDELPWTGDMDKDKALADSTYPEWDSNNTIYTNSKRNQHGGNYVKTYRGFARDAHISEAQAKKSFDAYHRFVRMLRPWHHHIAKVILSSGAIVSPLGRRWISFGRKWDTRNGGIDAHTHRQGVMFQPQSGVADILDTAMWHVWNEMDPDELWLLAQVHDALLGQAPLPIPASHKERVLRRLVELMNMPVRVPDFQGKTRVMRLGVDVKVGLNWGKGGKDNPDGLKGVKA